MLFLATVSRDVEILPNDINLRWTIVSEVRDIPKLIDYLHSVPMDEDGTAEDSTEDLTHRRQYCNAVALTKKIAIFMVDAHLYDEYIGLMEDVYRKLVGKITIS